MDHPVDPAEELRPVRFARRMGAGDALFWYAEAAVPQIRPIIGGLYVLDRHPDPERLEQIHDALLALMPRLRQRVVDGPLHLGLPEWVDDPHFDRSYHLRHVSLPEPGTVRELLDYVSTLLATPLDRERPLWEGYWIDGLAGGRSAYFQKLHHSVVDGVGALALIRAMTQPGPDAPVARVRDDGPGGEPAGLVGRLAALAGDTLRSSTATARQLARASWSAATDPARALDGLRQTADGLRGLLADAVAPTIRDPLCVEGSGLSRRLDMMELPLSRLRALKEALGVTLNDVVLTALTGTVADYHAERGVELDTLNCMVPMNLRPAGEADRLGNRVGMFNLALPLAETDPARRLERIVAQTRAAKTDHRSAGYPLVMQAATLLPAFSYKYLARRAVAKVNVCCTNIPGIREPRWMAGAAVEGTYPFVSVVEGMPLVVALLSYQDRLDVGIDTDPEAIPDPHRISELIEAHLAELERLARRTARRTGARRAASEPARRRTRDGSTRGGARKAGARRAATGARRTRASTGAGRDAGPTRPRR